MVENNIKAITQLVGKPLKDFSESDLLKVIESDRADLLNDLRTIEYLIENSNELIASLMQPIYIQMVYDSVAMDMEQHLSLLAQRPEYVDELNVQMESKLESTNVLEVLAATLVLLNYNPNFDFGARKEDIQKSLKMVEEIIIELPLPELISLSTALMNLYFPVVNLWHEKYNELLVEQNEEFRKTLQVYTEIIDQAEQMILDERTESEAENNG